MRPDVFVLANEKREMIVKQMGIKKNISIEAKISAQLRPDLLLLCVDKGKF